VSYSLWKISLEQSKTAILIEGQFLLGLRRQSSLGAKFVFAVSGGGEQLRELRRTPQRRQQRIILQGLVGTITSFDSTLKQPQRDVLLSAHCDNRASSVPVLGVRISQKNGGSCTDQLIRLGR
jgi:hypothetical protein